MLLQGGKGIGNGLFLKRGLILISFIHNLVADLQIRSVVGIAGQSFQIQVGEINLLRLRIKDLRSNLGAAFCRQGDLCPLDGDVILFAAENTKSYGSFSRPCQFYLNTGFVCGKDFLQNPGRVGSTCQGVSIDNRQTIGGIHLQEIRIYNIRITLFIRDGLGGLLPQDLAGCQIIEINVGFILGRIDGIIGLLLILKGKGKGGTFLLPGGGDDFRRTYFYADARVHTSIGTAHAKAASDTVCAVASVDTVFAFFTSGTVLSGTSVIAGRSCFSVLSVGTVLSIFPINEGEVEDRCLSGIRAFFRIVIGSGICRCSGKSGGCSGGDLLQIQGLTGICGFVSRCICTGQLPAVAVQGNAVIQRQCASF